MNIFELALAKIDIGFSKIIDSVRSWHKDKRKREDLEQIRRFRNTAEDIRAIQDKQGEYIARWLEKKANIIEDTMEGD